jgi:hypothetical protein
MARVGYALDDGTIVRFEVEPGPGFGPAGNDEVVGKLKLLGIWLGFSVSDLDAGKAKAALASA